jgi:hypothetical protein
MVMVT